MDNKISSKKTEITTIVKKFKEILDLHSDKITERDLKISKKCVKTKEDLVNDKDETDIEYLTCNCNNIGGVFKGVCLRYNIDHELKKLTINNSTFVETLKWINNKKCTINPQNNDNKCFQYSVTLSLYHKQIIGRNLFRISKVRTFINNLN